MSLAAKGTQGASEELARRRVEFVGEGREEPEEMKLKPLSLLPVSTGSGLGVLGGGMGIGAVVVGRTCGAGIFQLWEKMSFLDLFGGPERLYVVSEASPEDIFGKGGVVVGEEAGGVKGEPTSLTVAKGDKQESTEDAEEPEPARTGRLSPMKLKSLMVVVDGSEGICSLPPLLDRLSHRRNSPTRGFRSPSVPIFPQRYLYHAIPARLTCYPLLRHYIRCPLVNVSLSAPSLPSPSGAGRGLPAIAQSTADRPGSVTDSESQGLAGETLSGGLSTVLAGCSHRTWSCGRHRRAREGKGGHGGHGQLRGSEGLYRGIDKV